MLAATNTNPSNPSGRDTDSESWTLSTAVIGEQFRLPSPADQAGTVVVVDSKQYVLGERLGQGAGGSGFAATLKREAADVHSAGESHDPDSKALKLVGGGGFAEFR
eukprot:554850-Amphidinium_carterae.1